MAQMTPGTSQTDTYLPPKGFKASPADPRPDAIEGIDLLGRRSWEDFKRKHLGRYYVPRRLVNKALTTDISETTGMKVFHPSPATTGAGWPVDKEQLPAS